MTDYARIAGKTRTRRTRMTPQNTAIAGREAEMVENRAGGVSFKSDDFDRLRRFLILGVEGDTFYADQRTLVLENVECLDRCLAQDGRRVVDMVVEYSRRSLKQNAGLFVLASAAAAEDQDVRQYALDNLHRVARTLSALYTFAGYVSNLRGWGRGLRRAFANWLTKTPLEKLAYQSWKYKGRDGWTAQDIMRKVHPVTDDMKRAEIFTYMAKPRKREDWNPLLARGPVDRMNSEIYTLKGKVRKVHPALRQIEAAEELLHLEGSDDATVARAIDLINEHRLTHEAIPTHLRKSPMIWEALLEDMPMTAAVRNLGAMTANGLLTPMSDSQRKVVGLLTNAEAIERSGTHPMQFLIAARQYSLGRGARGNLSWTPNQKVLDALDDAYYASFGNVPVTGGNVLVAVDTSGSMSGSYNGPVMGIPGWNPLMAAAAFALVTLRTEPNAHLIGYDTSYHEMRISDRSRIDTVLRALAKHNGGGTNTALPVKYAADKKLRVDAIVSYTDNETWAGRGYWGYGHSRTGHVTEEVRAYADRYGPFKFLNLAMTASGTTDTDRENENMFELVGMDANTPRIISEYVQGNL